MMLSTSEMKGVAVFYPNRMGLQKVKVRGTSLLASNDNGTACHEIRHFINMSAVLSLDGGQDLLDSMVACTPAITRITGNNMNDQRVLGTLKEPLHVQCKFKKGPHKGLQIALILQNVVVVDKLPVPLHISTKQLLNITPKSGHEELGMFMNNFPSMLGFTAEVLSAEYKIHPFWNEGHFFGMTEEYTELKSHLEGTIPLDASLSRKSVQSTLCALCGASGRTVKLKACSRYTSLRLLQDAILL
jgi:hypothetical protein